MTASTATLLEIQDAWLARSADTDTVSTGKFPTGAFAPRSLRQASWTRAAPATGARLAFWP